MWRISVSKVPQCINPRIVINSAKLRFDSAEDNRFPGRRSTLVATRLSLWSLAAILAVAGVVTFPPALGQTTRIPDSTLVRLTTTQALSSATNSEDDQVPFQVTEDVKATSGITVISRGSTAIGHVNAVESKKRLGRAGKLSLVIDYVTASDGTRVRLRASSTRKGADKTGTVIIGTVLISPLFLIMRGKDVEIPQGTVFNAYVDGDREISTIGTTSQDAKIVYQSSAQPSQPSAQPTPEKMARQVSPTPAVSKQDTEQLVELYVSDTPLSDQALNDLVRSHRASDCTILTSPAGAEIDIEGKVAGKSPLFLTLMRHDAARVITVKLAGYVTVERKVVPDGRDISVSLQLEPTKP